jgi:methylmalonyl-CoA/ethylmalonyl-CoA epimerase
MKLDHIGVVVKDIEAAQRYYKGQFGFEALSPVLDEPVQKVKIVFIELGLGQFPAIELIQPDGESSPVFNFLKKTGGGLHHLSYEVEDLDRAIEDFKKRRSLMVGKIYPGAGHKGRRVAWFYTGNKELVELIEGERVI